MATSLVAGLRSPRLTGICVVAHYVEGMMTAWATTRLPSRGCTTTVVTLEAAAAALHAPAPSHHRFAVEPRYWVAEL